jgi:hypothetical protein
MDAQEWPTERDQVFILRQHLDHLQQKLKPALQFFYVGDCIVKGKANNACAQAGEQGANHLKAKIRTMCDEYGETCNYCD